jgi:hypothetical protein
MGLNWFIPALVKSRVGSDSGTTGEDFTVEVSHTHNEVEGIYEPKVWPRSSKNLRNVSLTFWAGHSCSLEEVVVAILAVVEG